MITGILLLAVITFIGVISYKRPRLEHKVIKNIPLIDWFNIFIVPLFVYFAITLIVKNILERGRQEVLDFEDATILSLGIFFLVYAFVGNSIHFVSKVISRYIVPQKRSLLYRINEIFHGKLSHYMVFLCGFMVIFLLGLLEVNHPLSIEIGRGTEWVILFAGMLSGISSTKIIFHASGWFGGYNKPLFFINSLFLFILLGIFRLLRLHLSFYPINIFVLTMFSSFIATFVFRQFLIFSHLGKKRRFHFLAKMLSVNGI